MLFRDFLSEIDLGALVLDQGGKVVFINDYLLRLLELSQDEMLGTDWFDVVPLSQREPLREVYSGSITTAASPGIREDSIVTRSGCERRLSWTSVVRYDSAGQVAGLAA